MKISGFTFIRNGDKLYYPLKESIQSVLDLVDEFVIALGDSDSDDMTREIVSEINSKKIKIIDTIWDLEQFPDGTEHAHQTDLAKNACTGDWLLYLQADEVIHEDDHKAIKSNCLKYLDEGVDGFVFNFIHFWGDYSHYQRSHGWYKNEIRIVRNNPEIHSFGSAQSFRIIPDFDGRSYRRKKGTKKLKCKKIPARVFHYGWVRPPDRMQVKRKYIDTNHHGQKYIANREENYYGDFDYGDLDMLSEYDGTHPHIMKDRIASFDWLEKLSYTKNACIKRDKHKHERLKYRLITFFEQHVFRGKALFESRNYKLV